MDRRRFNHLHQELSVAVEQLVPRYPLWLYLQERGWDPSQLSKSDVMSFVREGMRDFLTDRGLFLGDRAGQRLKRSLERFDPLQAGPDEIMARMFSEH